jgi:hypothetical protein
VCEVTGELVEQTAVVIVVVEQDEESLTSEREHLVVLELR